MEEVTIEQLKPEAIQALDCLRARLVSGDLTVEVIGMWFYISHKNSPQQYLEAWGVVIGMALGHGCDLEQAKLVYLLARQRDFWNKKGQSFK